MERLGLLRHQKFQQEKKFDLINKEYLEFYNEKLLQFFHHLQTKKKYNKTKTFTNSLLDDIKLHLKLNEFYQKRLAIHRISRNIPNPN